MAQQKLRVFRFQDLRDLDYAFIVAFNESQAIGILRKHTSLEITRVDCRSIDECPAIEEKMDGKPGIYIMNIMPF